MERELKEGRDEWGNNLITVKHFRKGLNKALKELERDELLMHLSSKRGFMFFVETSRCGFETYHITVDENANIEIFRSR